MGIVGFFDGTPSFAAQICHPLEGICTRGGLKGFSARGIWFRWKAFVREGGLKGFSARGIWFRWKAFVREGGLKGFSARRIWFRWKEKLRKWREDRPVRRIAFRWNAVLRGIQAARST